MSKLLHKRQLKLQAKLYKEYPIHRIHILLKHVEKNRKTYTTIRLFCYSDSSANDYVTYIDNEKKYLLTDKKNGLNFEPNTSTNPHTELANKFFGLNLLHMTFNKTDTQEILQQYGFTKEEYETLKTTVKEYTDYFSGSKHTLLKFQDLANKKLKKCCCTTKTPEKECGK